MDGYRHQVPVNLKRSADMADLQSKSKPGIDTPQD